MKRELLLKQLNEQARRQSELPSKLLLKPKRKLLTPQPQRPPKIVIWKIGRSLPLKMTRI
jgi:hypothetical protein